MSSEASVRARGLAKRYNLFETELGALAGAVAKRDAATRHWALRDFDLDASIGDFIGVIGRNGAGKSTLLQILAGILEPDAGELSVTGRIAAVLELGAGFNPDFSGWENARLSGSLHGLTRTQIDERLEAIAEFAELDDFMNRPAREYSSGMLAKLAVSVCLHVDADILVVDEVLAVGDFRFQQRATERLLRLSRTGIVFFVSHNETAVLSLCNRAVLISEGRKVHDGPTKSAFRAYHRAMSKRGGGTGVFREEGVETGDLRCEDDEALAAGGSGALSLSEAGSPERARQARPNGGGLVHDVHLRAVGTVADATFQGGERLVLSVHTGEVDLSDVFVAFLLRDRLGQALFSRDTRDLTGRDGTEAGVAAFGAEFEFVLPYLASGDYAFDVAVCRARSPEDPLAYLANAAEFTVVSRHISDGMANTAMDDVSITVTHPT